MLNIIKTQFSIKDLENFTGIKSHTIRIWEKRYGLLSPNRTDSNIRYYNSDNFLKLLNVNLLYQNGFKISKIAQLSEESITLKAKELASKEAVDQGALDQLKIAMVNFDVTLFNQVYNKLLAQKTFRELFVTIFIPFLDYIGLLWQTKSIKPAHEHFISNLIAQKLQANIEKQQNVKFKDENKIFVLFLPENEIHELGLLFLHYELILRGYNSIYLGQNIAIDHLIDLTLLHDTISYISYFTIQPSADNINAYLDEVQAKLLNNMSNSFYFLGRKTKEYTLKNNLSTIKPYQSMSDLLNNL